MKTRIASVIAAVSAIAILAATWPPFCVVGEVVMVTTPVPLWMRLTVAVFGKAFIFEPRWEFFAALCAEVAAAGWWLNRRRRTRSTASPLAETP